MHNLPRNELTDAVELLVEACHSASLNAGWWYDLKIHIDLREEACRGSRFGKALVAEKLCLIHSEVSEAMEGHRKDGRREAPEFYAITVELADAASASSTWPAPLACISATPWSPRWPTTQRGKTTSSKTGPRPAARRIKHARSNRRDVLPRSLCVGRRSHR